MKRNSLCSLLRMSCENSATSGLHLVKVMSTALCCTRIRSFTVSRRNLSSCRPPSTTLQDCTTIVPAPKGRRASKLVSILASAFTGSYVRRWGEHFGGILLHATPMFDGRAVCYPSAAILRDYLSWRQADTHVNNLYNTCFWALVKAGASTTAAHEQLRVRLQGLL